MRKVFALEHGWTPRGQSLKTTQAFLSSPRGCHLWREPTSAPLLLRTLQQLPVWTALFLQGKRGVPEAFKSPILSNVFAVMTITAKEVSLPIAAGGNTHHGLTHGVLWPHRWWSSTWFPAANNRHQPGPQWQCESQSLTWCLLAAGPQTSTWYLFSITWSPSRGRDLEHQHGLRWPLLLH